MQKIRECLLFIFIIFSFSFVSAEAAYSDCEIYGTCPKPLSSLDAQDLINRINYTNIQVNMSTFWGNYLYSDYNMPVIKSFGYNQSQALIDTFGMYWYNMTSTGGGLDSQTANDTYYSITNPSNFINTSGGGIDSQTANDTYILISNDTRNITDGTNAVINIQERALYAWDGYDNWKNIDFSLANALSGGGTGQAPRAYSNIFGYHAGYDNAGTANNFQGYEAGFNTTGVSYSNFLGYQAGRDATYASEAIMIGSFAGNNATSASYGIFIGSASGQQAQGASSSVFIGVNAGDFATNAFDSVIIGAGAGFDAPDLARSICIGVNACGNDNGNNRLNVGDINTSIAIGINAGTGGYSDSVAIGHAVLNSAPNEMNLGNVMKITGIYSADTANSTFMSGALVNIGNNNFTTLGEITGNNLCLSNGTNCLGLSSLGLNNTYVQLSNINNSYVSIDKLRIGGSYNATFGIINITGLINMPTRITLPTCGAGTNGSIGRNNSGVYGCSRNSVWTRLF